MSILTNPTTASIKKRVVLRPEQIDPLYGGAGATPSQAVEAYEADIVDRIEAQGNVVETMLLGRFTTTEIAAFSDPLKSNVSLAKELMTAGDLYDTAGQLNDQYEEKAQSLFARAQAIIKAIISLPNPTDTGGGAAGGDAQMLTIKVGENFSCDENGGY